MTHNNDSLLQLLNRYQEASEAEVSRILAAYAAYREANPELNLPEKVHVGPPLAGEEHWTEYCIEDDDEYIVAIANMEEDDPRIYPSWKWLWNMAKEMTHKWGSDNESDVNSCHETLLDQYSL